jgi:hypothetical protein
MGKGLKITLITVGLLGTGVGLYFLLRPRGGKNGKNEPKDDSIFDRVIRNTFYSDESFPLKKGSGGDKVKALQRFLNNANSTHNLDVDGKFGSLTEAALKSEQDPFEQFKVSYPDAVYGQVTQGYYNDFVKEYEGTTTTIPTNPNPSNILDRDNDGVSDYIDGDGGAGTNFTGGIYNNACGC